MPTQPNKYKKVDNINKPNKRKTKKVPPPSNTPIIQPNTPKNNITKNNKPKTDNTRLYDQISNVFYQLINKLKK